MKSKIHEHNKNNFKIVITLNYNNYTNNIVGLDSQIIPAYVATNDGQKQF